MRKPPKVRDPKHVFYKTYSSALHINGYKAKVITRYGIAKFFNVSLRTVHGWDSLGVLPEPFVMQQRGGIVVPVYLAAEIRCLMMVVTDLVAEGYVSIQWTDLHEHFVMLHAGYEQARAAFMKRLNGEKYGGEEAVKGVVFFD
jgi:hypothetical protein